MKVGFFQSDTRVSTPFDRLARLELALQGAALDLVVCPELFVSGFNNSENVKNYTEPCDGEFSQTIAAIARRYKTNIVYGYPESADGVTYNSAQCIDETGTAIANHRKRLFPSDYESGLFTAGNQQTVFTLSNGIKVGLVICYEIEFPEAARAVAKAGADIIVVPTACGVDWSIVTRKMVPVRAMENGVFLIYCNHAGPDGAIDFLGDSCVISPMGEDLARAGYDECLMSAELDFSIMEKARKRLPYLAHHLALP